MLCITIVRLIRILGSSGLLGNINWPTPGCILFLFREKNEKKQIRKSRKQINSSDSRMRLAHDMQQCSWKRRNDWAKCHLKRYKLKKFGKYVRCASASAKLSFC